MSRNFGGQMLMRLEVENWNLEFFNIFLLCFLVLCLKMFDIMLRNQVKNGGKVSYVKGPSKRLTKKIGKAKFSRKIVFFKLIFVKRLRGENN